MTPVNRRILFDAVRTPIFGGALTEGQVDGVGRILDYRSAHYPAMPEAAFAYLLATVTWETGHAMRPVKEGGGEAYLMAKSYYPWFGRGLVQCTWKANYAKYGCANNPNPPDAMLAWDKSLPACFHGMTNGIYTGKKLSDYFTATKTDFVGARHIINGTDRAPVIAEIARTWLQALHKAAQPLGPVIHAGPVETAPASPAVVLPPAPTVPRPMPPAGPPAAKPIIRPPAVPTSAAAGLWSRVSSAAAHAFFRRT